MDNKQLLSAFFAHLAPTSMAPMGMIVERACGSSIYTSDGNEYIDLLAGIGVAALGHGDQRILAAIAEQAARHLHVMVYGEMIQEQQVALAERLCSLLPAGLDCVYFTNSGTEAVEGALKLVRKVTGRSRLLAFEGGFHGDTLGSASVGGNPVYRDPFLPLLPDVGFMRFNDEASLEAIDESVAGVIVEPVQAEAGVIAPHDGFLNALRKRCSAAGALLIFDEVITGLGRSGKLFALEHQGAVPDVLLLAKALGGGLPLGAFISSKRALKALAVDPPLGHVTTFGGHPLSCAAGLAALNIIVDEDLAARAQASGECLVALLSQRIPADMVHEIRHSGLLVGMEMTSAALVEHFVAECRREGLIMGWTLHDDTVVRLAPPLIITEAEIEEATQRMARAAQRCS